MKVQTGSQNPASSPAEPLRSCLKWIVSHIPENEDFQIRCPPPPGPGKTGSPPRSGVMMSSLQDFTSGEINQPSASPGAGGAWAPAAAPRRLGRFLSCPLAVTSPKTRGEGKQIPVCCGPGPNPPCHSEPGCLCHFSTGFPPYILTGRCSPASINKGRLSFFFFLPPPPPSPSSLSFLSI